MGCEEVLLNHCQGQEHGQQGASNEGHVPGGGEGRGGEGRGGEGRGGECLPSRKIVLIITRSFTGCMLWIRLASFPAFFFAQS